jgi:hypothetical protein
MRCATAEAEGTGDGNAGSATPANVALSRGSGHKEMRRHSTVDLPMPGSPATSTMRVEQVMGSAGDGGIAAAVDGGASDGYSVASKRGAGIRVEECGEKQYVLMSRNSCRRPVKRSFSLSHVKARNRGHRKLGLRCGSD